MGVKDEVKMQIWANSNSVQNTQAESSYRTLSGPIGRPLPYFVWPSQIQTDSTQKFLPDFVQFSQTLSSLARTLSGFQNPAND
jgi:hypothetical protein